LTLNLPDLLQVGLTMAGVFAALFGARMARKRLTLPKPPLYPLYIGYNGLIAAILLLLHFAGVIVPGPVAPIAVVGGNAVLAELFGLPKLPARARKAKSKKGSAADYDPNREKIVPEAKKKRHKRRR
jgi:ABC-type uncharacterized transport system permease subunit